MKKKIAPLVSVILPAYNAEKFLVDSLESILDQTYKNIEIIVINDASTDKTAQIIASYKKKYSRKIKVITLTSNLNGGGDRCANLGIQKAKGTYIARMDADDIAHPTRIEKQVAFLEENSKVVLVGSNAWVINQDSEVIGEKLEPSSPHEIYTAYFTFHPMIHPSCMIRREISGKPFEYSIEYSANNDYNTFFKLLCKGHLFANLPEKLLYYRIHGKNDTFVHVKKKLMNTLKIRYTMVTQHGYTPTVKGVVSTLAQASMLLFPERMLISLYFLTKGITKPQNIFDLAKTHYRTRVVPLFVQ
jgi:glycosyltransferase involved in cell wall biosynthesis